jgi:hypothetical protein
MTRSFLQDWMVIQFPGSLTFQTWASSSSLSRGAAGNCLPISSYDVIFPEITFPAAARPAGMLTLATAFARLSNVPPSTSK